MLYTKAPVFLSLYLRLLINVDKYSGDRPHTDDTIVSIF